MATAVRLAVLVILLALAGCATSPEPVGRGMDYPPGPVAADGLPIWHRCFVIGGVTTSVCGGPAPAGYAEEP